MTNLWKFSSVASVVLWQSYDCQSACEVTLKVYCRTTIYPKNYAHGFVVLCFVVVMQSFIMNSHQVFIHIHQGCFAGTGAIVRLPQCQWSEPDGYGKISQCITTTKHSKAKTVCIFLGIYCMNTNVLPAMNTKCCVPLTCTFPSFCLAFNVLWLWLLLYLWLWVLSLCRDWACDTLRPRRWIWERLCYVEIARRYRKIWVKLAETNDNTTRMLHIYSWIYCVEEAEIEWIQFLTILVHTIVSK